MSQVIICLKNRSLIHDMLSFDVFFYKYILKLEYVSVSDGCPTVMLILTRATQEQNLGQDAPLPLHYICKMLLHVYHHVYLRKWA